MNGKRAAFTREDVHELVISPRAEDPQGLADRRARDYSGNPEAVIDPGRLARGLGADRRRRIRRQRAAGLAGLVSRERQPARQGDLHVRGDRARGPHGARERPARAAADRATARRPGAGIEDSPMAPYLATATNGPFDTDFTGPLNGIPIYNAVDPDLPTAQVAKRAGCADDRRRRSRSSRTSTASTRSRASATSSTGARGRLRARVADEGNVQHARARTRSSTRWPTVVRRRRHARRVGRHLAERGLRPLVGVDLERAPRGPDGPAAVRQQLRAAGRRTPASGTAARHPGGAEEHLRRADLHARRDDAPGAAPEGRRRRRSSGSCAAGTRRTSTGTSRRRTSSRSSERGERAAARSSSSRSGCTRPRSRRAGSGRGAGLGPDRSDVVHARPRHRRRGHPRADPRVGSGRARGPVRTARSSSSST